MPSLADICESLVPEVIVASYFMGCGFNGMPETALFNNSARLVDHAIQQYEGGREALAEFRSARAFTALLRGVSDLEAALVSTHRAILFIERLRQMGFCHADGTPVIPRRRDFEPLDRTVTAKYRELRDAIQHLDERILSLTSEGDSVVMLFPREANIELEGLTHAYTDWARHLRLLRELVRKILGTPTDQLLCRAPRS